MKGLIAFFDILGYQSFLENNSATESALHVLDLINKIPTDTNRTLVQQWGQYVQRKSTNNKEKAPIDVSSSLTHLIFSDTIVLAIPYPENAPEIWKDSALFYLSIACARLTSTMFAQGLPLRGVLHEGDYIFKDSCFAGKGIIEAYKCCNSLDFSGMVYSTSLKTHILSRQSGDAIFARHSFDRYFVQILTPHKNSAEERMLHINWLSDMTINGNSLIGNDVIQAVMRSFWGHGKDCGRDADGKVRNTCKVMRRLIIAAEEEEKNLPAQPKAP